MLIAATLLTLPASLLLIRSGGYHQTVERSLARASTDRLAAEAERLWDANGGPLGETHSIAEEDWPPGIRAFRPQAVRIASEGVSLQTREFFVEESGLFLLPPGSAFSPPSRGDPSYQPIEASLFFYDMKG